MADPRPSRLKLSENDVLGTRTERRSETGELLMLLVATLDAPDGSAGEACSVTAKLLRSRTGEIVALTRVTMAGTPPGRPELERAAQRLADHLVDLVGRYLGAGSAGRRASSVSSAADREARVRGRWLSADG